MTLQNVVGFIESLFTVQNNYIYLLFIISDFTKICFLYDFNNNSVKDEELNIYVYKHGNYLRR